MPAVPVINLSFGKVGAFDDEFKTGRYGIEYRFNTYYRMGVTLFHLSNAELSDNNPGTEALVFSLSISLKNNWSNAASFQFLIT